MSIVNNINKLLPIIMSSKTFVITLFNRVSEASSRPRTERRTVKNHHDSDSDEEESRSAYSLSPTPEVAPSAPPPASNGSYYSGPFKALYDFESGKALLILNRIQ